MIRDFKSSDMNDVLDIWLEASVKAHGFAGKEFWESKIDDMRNKYIPASDTYVFSNNGSIKGFFSISGDTLAAIFVSPNFQGKGIGQQLMNKAKSMRKRLYLAVYNDNPKSIHFYRKCGFTTIDKKIDKHTGHIEIIMEYNSSRF